VPEPLAASFAARIVDWQRQAGRHGLPWQNTREAYRIWLSEIMLQQTQVSAVIPYYERFLGRFPDLSTLADAPLETVLEHWSGLGYYSRARNLHRCAQTVAVQYNGRFPDEPSALAELPGIGRSTAAAIAAFAYGKRAAILDGNVKRVFCRHFGVEGAPTERVVLERLWTIAEAELPAAGIEPYTQGLMDLGATLCTRSRPRCGQCPVAATCVAAATGRTAELPTPRPRKTVPHRRSAALVLVNDTDVLLEKRPTPGIWAGLWSLPECAPDTEHATAHERYGLDAAGLRGLAPIEHAFTHYRLTLQPMLLAVAQRADCRLPDDGHAALRWTPLAAVEGMALPAPIKRFLLALRAGHDAVAAARSG
jgi:A/G-specific adenine glycosylase